MKMTGNISMLSPIKDVLLNREELMKHATELAHLHLQNPQRRKQQSLIPRVMENARFLSAAHHTIINYVHEKQDVVPAAEWFLDNYYLLKDFQTEIQRDLPKKYENQLPHLNVGNHQGFPRVFELMFELVEHTDSKIQENILRDFINTYQELIPLASGEIWAIPIMLKITLLENIRRLVEKILLTQEERQTARQWVSPFENHSDHPEKWEELLETVPRPLSFTPTYTEALGNKIKDFGLDGAPLQRWLERALNKQEMSIEAMSRLEHQRQTGFQISMGNAISSVRFLMDEDWPQFFEEISMVQRVLVSDPTDIFAKLDFESRDYYRHRIEEKSRQWDVPELLLARKVVELSSRAQDSPQNHIGYYLLGNGQSELEQAIRAEQGRRSHPIQQGSNSTYLYFGSIFLLAAAMLVVVMGFLAWNPTVANLPSAFLFLLAALLAVFPISNIAITIVNWFVSHWIKPAFFPKLEMRDGIPESARTMVVIPALLPNEEKVKELFARLEIYYLANQDPNLYFAVLGDFCDATLEEMPGDLEVIEQGKQECLRLQHKYGDHHFFFMHRKRQWNASENCWMGWERKRGKLLEFNRLLVEGEKGSYCYFAGQPEAIRDIKYIITLDCDTQLVRDSAKGLIGALAHPLQAAVLNEEGTRVISGYGILQPRIGIDILNGKSSFFARIFTGKTGIDPYTAAVSDVYQDLFGEGIFTGKGIYDLKVFHQVTRNAFPENKILSHDLIEGLFVRAGLVTDIQLIDGFPAKYHAHVRRLHRWVRGDWQLLPYLAQKLPFLSHWKIADNLRRSLLDLMQFLLIIAGFSILPGNGVFWAMLVMINLLLPALLHTLDRVLFHDDFPADLGDSFIQILLGLTFLPYQAQVMADAVVRSVTRQYISHKNLLEWETADDTEQRMANTHASSWRLMWPSVAFCWLIFFILGFSNLRNAVGFLPFLILWTLSPWLAYKISQPLVNTREALASRDLHELRLEARRIWSFFEDHVTEAENWLPPDNVQFDPPRGIAHRTSPTNIGLALLANLAGYDLGYLTVTQTVDRIDHTLKTLESMERWQGHLYNWYDTLTLEPLHPMYISTVDSGNLAVYLLTLREGLNDILQAPTIRRAQVEGLYDTYELFKEAAEASETARELRATGNIRDTRDARDARDSKDTSDTKDTRNTKDANAVESAEAIKASKGIDATKANEATVFDAFKEFEDLLVALRDPDQKQVDNQAAVDIQAWQSLLAACPTDPLAALPSAFSNEMPIVMPSDTTTALPSVTGEASFWLAKLKCMIDSFKSEMDSPDSPLTRIQELQKRLEDFALAMDFRPLYNQSRQLFSIGYRVQDGAMDRSYYDLLASEARQSGFFAIAKGDVPQSHWFRLGRGLIKAKGRRCLVSWSGTMFEYLMPLVVMRNYPDTILDETYRSVVELQSHYGKSNSIPWGISESGFYAFDNQLNYQYKAFGIPGLGLKRGLLDDLVIAPYASFLALQVSPLQALHNIRAMKNHPKLTGVYGLHEAADFTPNRLPADQRYRVVQSYMAHHQGMSLLSLVNTLLQNRLQDRFHRHPLVQATELILQEKLPAKITMNPPPEELSLFQEAKEGSDEEYSRFIHVKPALTALPVTYFIGNGNYSVVVTNSGSGFSNYQQMSISRWRSDFTQENWGMYFYIQNLNSGNVWSATYQPLQNAGKDYQVTYAPDKVEFQRQDGNIKTRTQIFVSSEDQVEIRRLTITNVSQHERILEITSFFEVVLAPHRDDIAHPVFNNLFIQTEYTHNALIASRRLRHVEQKPLWLMHTVCSEDSGDSIMQYETDRSRFIGRGRDLTNPLALELNQPLSNTVGNVLDPIMSLRKRIVLPPGKSLHLSFSTGVAANRHEVIRLAEKYQDTRAVQRAMEMAWTHSQMELRHFGISPQLANQSLGLGSYLVFTSLVGKDQRQMIPQNTRSQSSLWPHAISGDIPVLLVRVSQIEHLELIRQLLKIHDYWLQKGLNSDLVILNEDESGYMQTFYDHLRDLVAVGHSQSHHHWQGKVHIIQKKHLAVEDEILLQAVAKLTLSGDAGSLAAQLRNLSRDACRKPLGLTERRAVARDKVVKLIPATAPATAPATSPALDQGVSTVQNLSNSHKALTADQEKLWFYNGLGGFSQDGKEYIVELRGGSHTPLPWLNICANEQFGFQVSTTGSGYTWAGNSREHKLTTWSNDPVLDPLSEVIYLRDESSREVWTITPDPIRSKEKYLIKHGQGYTEFEYKHQELSQKMTLFVPLDGKIKISHVQLTNHSERRMELSATYYAELVMGVSREVTSPYIVTAYDEETGSLQAHNVYDEDFSGRTVFLKAYGGVMKSYTGDRTEFIGRYGSLKDPEGLAQDQLSQKTGAGLDPCLVLQSDLTIEPDETKDIYFIFGEEVAKENIAGLLAQYSEPAAVNMALARVKIFWEDLFNTLQVKTPDQSLNLLVNRWLLYQVIVCRLWARSAFYQSGGAYGFRDQLQDAMSLSITKPQWMREQILLHSRRQFKEGDVQHWWHSEEGKGIRTKFSDDLLWLPYVTLDYLEHTQDDSILEEVTPFLEEELLAELEDERYTIPQVSAETGTLYEHCIRAIDRSLRFGSHGLPLIGTGDWNDGLNHVGRLGKGESVWLGWFILIILDRFVEICAGRGDTGRADYYRETYQTLRMNLEQHGWDGGWYRRAYFDDGTPIGSAENSECQIDALAQSWAVLAGASKESRLNDAMLALENYLWRKDDGILLLLTPPFDKSERDPGYIRGYIPGVRENGGQYTHGAVWTVMAFVARGQGNKALELYQMLNPINHARTEQETARYKAEPYVVAADVYANSQHTGRGGWSWYTGAAGWMYQAAVESILGLHIHGDQLTLQPCISSEWNSYSMDYRYGQTHYEIMVQNPRGKMVGISELYLDEQLCEGDSLPLVDDGVRHKVLAVM
ncbi:MAG: GH36-type glycosyl hydrolase domain-containing protein [Desulfitobacterium sp.]